MIRTDIWWLVWGVFLVAIIEHNNLLDDEKKWFDIFRVLFELVSAFGGIGLTLGVPYVSCPNPEIMCTFLQLMNPPTQDNFSFVGGMRPLSKLVVIVIMYAPPTASVHTDMLPLDRVRGRHRGLPVAVDRAIMLPHELMKLRQQQQAEEHQKNGQAPQQAQPPSVHSEQSEHGLGLVFSGHGAA